MKSYVILKVSGKNIDNFIKKLAHNSINIYKIRNINSREIIIKINIKDYDKVNKIKTIYDIEIMQYSGLKKIKDDIKINNILIVSIIFGIILFIILLNIIFKVEIVHNNKEIRDLISLELKKYGLTKYSFKKHYQDIEKIEKKIIDDNKDKIEWLEIENVGTKYVVRVEERIIDKKDDEDGIYNIVSSKDAVIKKIIASSGEVVKELNSYVKKGETIISSNITFNGEIKNIVSAKGTIYGETWYKVSISYPLEYHEEILTGNKKNKFLIKIFDNYIDIFKSYKYKKTNDKVIIKNDLLPFSIVKQTQREIKIINDKLEYKEALNKALSKAREKMENKLDDKEYIIYEKCLKNSENNSKMDIVVFYAVYEDITSYVRGD